MTKREIQAQAINRALQGHERKIREGIEEVLAYALAEGKRLDSTLNEWLDEFAIEESGPCCADLGPMTPDEEVSRAAHAARWVGQIATLISSRSGVRLRRATR